MTSISYKQNTKRGTQKGFCALQGLAGFSNSPLVEKKICPDYSSYMGFLQYVVPSQPEGSGFTTVGEENIENHAPAFKYVCPEVPLIISALISLAKSKS